MAEAFPRREGPAEGLELLGRDDEDAAQVARAVAVAAPETDPLLLLDRQLHRVPERVAAVLSREAVVVLGLRGGQSQEGADVRRALGELLEQGAPALLPISLLAALPVSTPEQSLATSSGSARVDPTPIECNAAAIGSALHRSGWYQRPIELGSRTTVG